MMLWTWFLDVAVFRILSQAHITLNGVVPQSHLDVEKMTATLEGQVFAAERFACQFADSMPSNGSNFFGFGRYCNALATTAANNPTEIPCAKPLVEKVRIQSCRSVDEMHCWHVAAVHGNYQVTL